MLRYNTPVTQTVCEGCGKPSGMLRSYNKQLLCPECIHKQDMHFIKQGIMLNALEGATNAIM